jgi:hypothetical protein
MGTDTQEHQRWAGELATKTEGVVAVINRIESDADVRSTFGFARDELASLGGRKRVRHRK